MSRFGQLLILVLACVSVAAKSGQLLVTIDTGAVRFQVEKFYLSVNLETSVVSEKNFNFSSQRLHTLLSGLSPSLLRVGGSSADTAYFDSSAEKLKFSGLQPSPIVLTKQYWGQLVRLANDTGSRLLYDLNLQQRDGVQWGPENTLELLQFTVDQGLAGLVDFELGNEPDAYTKKGQEMLTGDQIGQDFLMLKRILNSYHAYFKNSKVVGPDVIGVAEGKRGNDILKGFAKVAAHNVTAMTVHQYYFRGDQAEWKDYIDPSNFPLLADTIRAGKGIISSCPNPRLPLWIGETSDSWHAGTVDVSDRFISGFLWLEKLGLAAYMGVGVVMRQTFLGGYYCLVDKNFMPNPDYWLSHIYKRLVGSRVLSKKVTALAADYTDDVRVYVHCTRPSPRYQPGAITLYALNVNVNDSTTIIVKGALSMQKVDVYLLTPGDKDGMLSKYVSLNGRQLHLVNDSTLPELEPVSQPASVGIKVPALTFVFVVFPDANVKICW
ncbi:Hyaluronoglucuronidase [Lamellibrachia satsuma]|nr:Hyaluronoglucuronidase [Lamellibrachia satsuma]